MKNRKRLWRIVTALAVIVLSALLYANYLDVVRAFSDTTKTPNFDQTEVLHPLFPDYTKVVLDLQDILSDEQEKELSDMLIALQTSDSVEVALVTIEQIAPYDSLYNYSLDLANHWNIGKRHNERGILIAVSTTLREIRIQNTKSITVKLGNAQTEEIIANHIVPYFKKDEYFLGLKEGIIALTQGLQ